MSVYELAKKYYPRLWDRARLEALAAAGRLTEAEVREIVGEEENHVH